MFGLPKSRGHTAGSHSVCCPLGPQSPYLQHHFLASPFLPHLHFCLVSLSYMWDLFAIVELCYDPVSPFLQAVDVPQKSNPAPQHVNSSPHLQPGISCRCMPSPMSLIKSGGNSGEQQPPVRLGTADRSPTAQPVFSLSSRPLSLYHNNLALRILWETVEKTCLK